ncbi:MAG: hypothetical protein ACRDQF_11930, partial [Thermocrispum sp.]
RHRSGHPFRRFLGEWWDDSWSRATEARHRHYERKCSGDLPRQRAGRAARHKCDEWRHRHDTDRATAERPTSPGAQTVPPESDTERTGPIHVVAERLPLPAADPDLLATPHPEERNPATMTDNHANTPPVADSTASEVTNINTALAYTRDMGEQFRAAVAHAETLGAQAHQMSGWAAQSTTNAETAVADISAGEVTGEAVESLRTAHEQMVIAAVQVDQAARALNVAQEQFAATAAAFDTAHQAFQRQQTVAEAYAANPDAGSKQFNTYA